MTVGSQSFKAIFLRYNLHIRDRISIYPGIFSWILTITILVSFAILNISWHKLAIPDTPEIDGYFFQADRILNGEAYQDLYHPPLFTLLTANFSRLLGVNTLLAGSLVSAISVAIFSLLTFWLARYYLVFAYALLAQVLIGIDWLVFRMGVSAGTDALFAVLALSILLALVIRQKQPDSHTNKTIGTVLLGLLFGLMLLTRYNALFFLPLVAAGLLLEKKPWWRKVQSSLLFLGIVLLVCAPWLMYNLKFNGSMFANENWRNLALALYGENDFSYLDRAPFSGYIDVIAHDPQRTINLWKENILFSIGIIPFLHSSSPLLALLLPLGVITFYKKGEAGKLFLLYFVGCLLSFGLTFRYYPRFLLPMLPISVLFCSVGLEKLMSAHTKDKRFRIIILDAIIIAPLVLTYFFGRQTILAQPKREVELLNRLVMEGRLYDEKLAVMSTFPYADYFTNSPESLTYTWVPHYDPNFPKSLVTKAISEGAEFILVSDRTTIGAIRDGSIESFVPDCWKIWVSEEDSSGVIRIYHNNCVSPTGQAESSFL